MIKTYRVIFAARADAQIAQLYEYISDEAGTARAERFVAGILRSCAGLSTFPERGHKRDDIRPGLRIIGFARRVTIVFSVDKRAGIVTIIGIFYGGQNYELALREGGSPDG